MTDPITLSDSEEEGMVLLDTLNASVNIVMVVNTHPLPIKRNSSAGPPEQMDVQMDEDNAALPLADILSPITIPPAEVTFQHLPPEADDKLDKHTETNNVTSGDVALDRYLNFIFPVLGIS